MTIYLVNNHTTTMNTNPNNINRLIEKPSNAIKIKTPISETGIAQNGINEALAVPKNKYVTALTKIIAKITITASNSTNVKPFLFFI